MEIAVIDYNFDLAKEDNRFSDIGNSILESQNHLWL